MMQGMLFMIGAMMPEELILDKLKTWKAQRLKFTFQRQKFKVLTHQR